MKKILTYLAILFFPGQAGAKLKIVFATFLLQFLATHLFSQIPNNGFELWNNMGSYLEPQDYKTANTYAIGTFYPVTRATDHYPAAVGNYSIKIESNTSIVPNFAACGVALQTHEMIIGGPRPYFRVAGHPASFTGYFKYFPQNNDTMFIMLLLFHGGMVVADATLTATSTVPDWTSFVVPISNYNAADSGAILLASYNANGPPPSYFPRGNSVLYADNLNFDFLINSIDEQGANRKDETVFYPNPARDKIYFELRGAGLISHHATVTIFNNFGEIVIKKTILSASKSLDISQLLPGIYFLVLENSNTKTTQKLVKIK
jgi:hypothetical protein